MLDKLPYDIHDILLVYFDYDAYISILNTSKILRQHYMTTEHVKNMLNKYEMHPKKNDATLWDKLHNHANIEFMLMRIGMETKQRMKIIEHFKMDIETFVEDHGLGG